jgi:hypothetical protein
MEPEMISLCKLHGAKLDAVADDLATIKKFLVGNGKSGLIQEVDNLKNFRATVTRILWIVLAGALTVFGATMAGKIIQ